MTSRRRGTLTSGALAPLSVEGLVAWYDGELSPITSSSGSVSQWGDISGNGNHATQSTGSLQPTTGSTTLNGKNVIDFDGTQVLEGPSALYSIPNGPNTIFVISKTNTTGTLSDEQCVVSFTETAFTRRVIQYDNTLNQVESMNATTGGGSPFAEQDNVLVNEFNIFTSRFEGGGGTTRFQSLSYNSNTETTSINGQTESGIDGLAIGARETGLTEALNGSIFAVLIYDRFLSLAEKQRIENYFSARTAIKVDPIGRYRPYVWYDPSLGGTVTTGVDGESVSRLEDISGNDRPLNQSTASLQLKTGQNQIKGRNVLTSAATTESYGYLSRSVTLPSDNTFFGISRVDGYSGGNTGPFALTGGGNTQWIIQNFNTFPNARYRLETNAGTAINQASDAYGDVVTLSTIRMRYSQLDFSLQLYSDTNPYYSLTRTYSGAEISGATSLVYGARALSAEIDGLLGEAAVYDYALTDTQSNEVQAHLVNKWIGNPIGYYPVLWLDAADSATIDAPVGKVESWTDRSNGNNDATQVIATNQPSLSSSSAVSLGAIDFSPVDEALEISSSSTITDMFSGGGEVIFAINLNDDGGSGAGRLASKNKWSFVTFDQSGSTCKLQFNVTTSGTNGQWRTTSNVITFGQDLVISLSYDSDAIATAPVIKINNEIVDITTVTSPTGTYTSDVSDDLFIGNRSALDRGLDGLVYEVHFYNRSLSDIDYANIYSHISDKWQI